ncbi:2TM domain-containing protein [Ulvibacter sp. MAR_2010_11]|uniref:2TM domain-containing protein n=1 Tax=Ulvibacter sp. MAR_2010_11 TaxID=1250229 RepID=UPI000C2BF7E8|nr:2TM domain-containing protein [Ulvibacter sp. MAR_2010_11]PKA83865.1 2TM domain-containing protein [Ulvibacter sp. MAR_2010_11]
MEDLDKIKYKRAKKKIKEIKGFYSHLTVYIVINILLLLMHMGLFHNGFFDFNFEVPTWPMFTTPFFWGIGLLFHGLYVFQDKFSFFKNWEERKIREFMEKDEEELKRTNKWNKQ